MKFFVLFRRIGFPSVDLHLFLSVLKFLLQISQLSFQRIEIFVSCLSGHPFSDFCNVFSNYKIKHKYSYYQTLFFFDEVN